MSHAKMAFLCVFDFERSPCFPETLEIIDKLATMDRCYKQTSMISRLPDQLEKPEAL